MPIDLNATLEAADPEISIQIANEIARQHEGLEMIASENFVSRAVLEAAGTVFTNKYAEGYPGKRYYGGREGAGGVENSAHGGHLTHGHKLNFSGKLYRIVGYQVSRDTETVDYDELEAIAKRENPKVIVGGGSAYPRTWDFERMRAIADSVGAYLMIDMEPFAGLVAGGVDRSPIPHAHMVTTTTHKTLRGPRGGMVFCKSEFATGLDRSVFPGQQGGPLMHVIAAKAVAFREALQPEFAAYSAQTIANAKELAAALAAEGYRI